MEISSEDRSGVSIVRVKGKVVRENRDELRRALEEIVERGTKGIALDFDGVDYIDSSGLGSCAAVQKKLDEKKAGPLVLFGASPNIAKMWKLIKLDLSIPLCADEREALERIVARRPAASA